jgi:hypothetical protein
MPATLSLVVSQARLDAAAAADDSPKHAGPRGSTSRTSLAVFLNSVKDVTSKVPALGVRNGHDKQALPSVHTLIDRQHRCKAAMQKSACAPATASLLAAKPSNVSTCFRHVSHAPSWSIVR